MTNSVFPTPYFSRRAKPLLKKHRTLLDSLYQLETDLIADPYIGDSYGSNIYKIRIADESKGKGKSGGFRVITYLVIDNHQGIEIYLIDIFDKANEASISKNEVLKLLKKCGLK